MTWQTTCIEVGLTHGRLADIYVPPEQILDTVSIYYLPERQRKLSLRFLAWTVLTQHVQSAGTHDSIEDARTALQLYQEYQRMLEDGTWSDDLEDIFREGKRLVSFLASLSKGIGTFAWHAVFYIS